MYGSLAERGGCVSPGGALQTRGDLAVVCVACVIFVICGLEVGTRQRRTRLFFRAVVSLQ